MKLFVMTGVFGAGKTTWIKQMLPVARELGIQVAGVVTPAVFEGHEKTAIDAMLLPSGERFLFAPKAQGHVDGVKRLGWDFKPEAIERINGHLATCASCDLFVVDELGPLEILRGEGYTEALALLDSGCVANALVVIRPALLDAARERWGDFDELAPDCDCISFLAALDRP